MTRTTPDGLQPAKPEAHATRERVVRTLTWQVHAAFGEVNDAGTKVARR